MCVGVGTRHLFMYKQTLQLYISTPPPLAPFPDAISMCASPRRPTRAEAESDRIKIIDTRTTRSFVSARPKARAPPTACLPQFLLAVDRVRVVARPRPSRLGFPSPRARAPPPPFVRGQLVQSLSSRLLNAAATSTGILPVDSAEFGTFRKA